MMIQPIGCQPVTEERLQEVTRRIVEALSPEKVVLFGSYVYGSPTPDSDVDLLIIMHSDQRPAKRVSVVSRLFHPRPFPMDIVVRTPQEIEHSRRLVDPFIREVLEKGRVLYDRERRS
jgi:predicted nucleotidyltransferase